MSISVPAYWCPLTHFPSPDMPPRMGRPSLNVEETKVRLTAGVKDRIIALVGKQRMAAFIRDAVEVALAKAEKLKPGKGATEGSE